MVSPFFQASVVAQRLKCLPAMQETRVQSRGREDPLEKDPLEKATHSSILAWRIPWMEEPGGLQSTGSQRVGHDWATSLCYAMLCYDASFPRLFLLLPPPPGSPKVLLASCWAASQTCPFSSLSAAATVVPSFGQHAHCLLAPLPTQLPACPIHAAIKYKIPSYSSFA